MKKSTLLIITGLLLILITFTQCKTDSSLRISGQFTNSTEDQMVLYRYNEDGLPEVDTIHFDENGGFNYVSDVVKVPTLAKLYNNSIQINNFFIAPGFELTITGDAFNVNTLRKTKQISEGRSKINDYLIIYDSIILARNNFPLWFQFEEKELIDFANEELRLKDSVAKAVLNSFRSNDKTSRYFENLLQYERDFSKLYYLLYNLNKNIDNFSIQEANTFLYSNFDKTILDDIYNEKYFISYRYRSLLTSDYSAYLANIAFKKDSLLRNKRYYSYDIIDKNYKGKIREYSLEKKISSKLMSINTLEKLNDYNQFVTPYLDLFETGESRQRIQQIITAAESQLRTIKEGQLAPDFLLADTAGNLHTLSDHIGKVVLLDIWSSTCKPCRLEVPYLKEIVKKYEPNSEFKVIGIAVKDGLNAWKKAITEDDPTWLQLIDKEDKVAIDYTVVFIPRYILISKTGEIVTLNAPYPSKKEELYRLIDQELRK